MSDRASATSHPIVTFCGTVFTANARNCQADCSGYLKQVAAQLAVVLPNVQANGLVDFLVSAADWTQLENNARQASNLASQGNFVVAGLKEAGHGHVAIVVPGWSPQGFPMGFWGSIRGASFAGANASLTRAWTRDDLALVSYFTIPVAALSR